MRAPKQTMGAPRSAAAPAQLNVVALAQHLAGEHLFGSNPADTPAATPTAAVDITVEGLLYSEDQTAALAILAVAGKSGFFHVGDALPDGETVSAIDPTSVQLVEGMNHRVIELPSSVSGPADGILLAGDTGLPARLLLPGVKPYVSALRPVIAQSGASDQDRLKSLRQQLIKH